MGIDAKRRRDRPWPLSAYDGDARDDGRSRLSVNGNLLMHRSKVRLLTLICVTGVAASGSARARAEAFNQTRPALATRPVGGGVHRFARWEKDIAAHERADREHPPAKGGVLFIGSSTIVRWKTLAADFPDHHVINRGFGGSEIADSTHFAERIIFPYEPRTLFLRAGGNDIHAGKSPEQVFNDFKAFAAKVHARLPESRIVFISLSPAPSRWNERDANKKLNTLVSEYVQGKPYLAYVETYDLTITPQGDPREELFVADRLHPNAAGYKLLAERVRPFLPKTR